MPTVEDALYKWILVANEKRDELSLPPGLIEDSVGQLLLLLGRDYLDDLLVSGSEPISFFDSDVNPLKKWLKSALVEQHVVQILELAAYFRTFKDDPALGDKIHKLKRDRFRPVFFELAMAARMKAACQGSQSVTLNREQPDVIGDFALKVDDTNIACECSRLGHSPEVDEPHILSEHITKRIADATEQIRIPLIFKIRSKDALCGRSYNLILRLLRKCLADIKKSRLPTVHFEGTTSICCGELTPSSERMPFRLIHGVVTNVEGTDWDSAQSLKRVLANEEEVIASFKDGKRFQEFEAVRIFMKFGPPNEAPDEYQRLANKLRKKLKQTKVVASNHGKVVFIEVPSDLRSADKDKLNAAITDAVKQSQTTLGVVFAHREGNPHYRHHYSLLVALNPSAIARKPELMAIFDRFRSDEARTDSITGLPYQTSWEEAYSRVQARREQSNQ